MKKVLFILSFFILFSCTPTNISNNTSTSMKKLNSIVTLETEKGTIKIELADNDAPLTVENFKNLVKQKFYDGLTFHRVEPGFVVQGGDPDGTGGGGSDKEIDLEIYCTDGKKFIGEVAPQSCTPVLTHKKGAVAMARTPNPNSATSQFYITLDATPFLDRDYAVFGYVIEGMDVVEKIKVGDKMLSVVLK